MRRRKLTLDRKLDLILKDTVRIKFGIELILNQLAGSDKGGEDTEPDPEALEKALRKLDMERGVV